MAQLYIVPTPIGNLEDMTLRAIRILKEANLILAEDTRTSARLLDHFGITTKMLSHHAFNEHHFIPSILKKIESGQTLALISDAGTPAISDPGFLLVRACLREGIRVECLPGPTALIPALVNSGIACNKFYFEGFLPNKKGRQTRLLALSQLDCTIILYESPFRLVKTLEQLVAFFGPDRQACVSRELTKIHEENARGTLVDLILHYGTKPVKGEIVIIIEGNTG